jgi:hypothetical protein
MANVRKTKQMSKNQRGVLKFFFKATSDSRAFIFGNAFPVLLFLLPPLHLFHAMSAQWWDWEGRRRYAE